VYAEDWEDMEVMEVMVATEDTAVWGNATSCFSFKQPGGQ